MSSKVSWTQAGSRRSRSARMIFCAGVGCGLLVGVEQVLVELLPGPMPDDLDRDIALRFES